jgi:acyl transferase domain-containing protein/3-hydroxy-3-methylglutaryl CoA synthase/enoyl-CoA hydratase/carnithine racemase/NAD(P)-dependent dehydrogenase (short-subunit alcohol dehydrogenase family)/acyl carrier protein
MVKGLSLPTLVYCRDRVPEGAETVFFAATWVVSTSRTTFPASLEEGYIFRAAPRDRITGKAWNLIRGREMNARLACEVGLVDILLDDGDESAALLNRLLTRIKASPYDLLQKCYSLPARSSESALVIVGQNALSKVEKPLVASGDLVKLSYDSQGFAILELNNPERFNSLNAALLSDLSAAISRLKRDLRSVRAVLVKGAGEHFCIGRDPYEQIANTSLTLPELSAKLSMALAVFVELRSIPVPIVCAVHGKLLGGGIALALCSDVIIALEGTTFEHANLARGLCPVGLYSKSLQFCVGNKKATTMYLLEKILSDREALATGLVLEVHKDTEALYKRALELASFFAQSCTNFSTYRMPIDEDHALREYFYHALCLTDLKSPASTSTTSSVDLLASPLELPFVEVIEVPEVLDASELEKITSQLSRARGLVIVRAEGENFCLGGDGGNSNQDLEELILNGSTHYRTCCQAMLDCRATVIVVCKNATRGGGMLFPCAATVVLAEASSTFGFPEIRRQVLPALVSVVAPKRIPETMSKQLFCSGETLNASKAAGIGLVDFVGLTEDVQAMLDLIVASGGKNLFDIWKAKNSTFDEFFLETFILPPQTLSLDAIQATFLASTGRGEISILPTAHASSESFLQLAHQMSQAFDKFSLYQKQLRYILLRGLEHLALPSTALSDSTLVGAAFKVLSALSSFQNLGVPVLSLFTGEVGGLAVSASFYCDYAVATEDSCFQLFQETETGLLADSFFADFSQMSRKFPSLVAAGPFSATVALHEGLINEVWGSIEEATYSLQQLCSRLSCCPATGLKSTMKLMRDKAAPTRDMAFALGCSFNPELYLPMETEEFSSFKISRSENIVDVHVSPQFWESIQDCAYLTVFLKKTNTPLALHVGTPQVHVTPTTSGPSSYNIVQMVSSLLHALQQVHYTVLCSGSVSPADLIFLGCSKSVVAKPETTFSFPKFGSHPLLTRAIAYALTQRMDPGTIHLNFCRSTSLPLSEALRIGLVDYKWEEEPELALPLREFQVIPLPFDCSFSNETQVATLELSTIGGLSNFVEELQTINISQTRSLVLLGSLGDEASSTELYQAMKLLNELQKNQVCVVFALSGHVSSLTLHLTLFANYRIATSSTSMAFNWKQFNNEALALEILSHELDHTHLVKSCLLPSCLAPEAREIKFLHEVCENYSDLCMLAKKLACFPLRIFSKPEIFLSNDVGTPVLTPIDSPSSHPVPLSIPKVEILRDTREVGIHAMEVYIPRHKVKASELEIFHNVPGKYSKGLMFEELSFTSDDEDSVSMALTVVSRLLERHNISPEDIGYLTVGTESLLDRSKSIKSHLMRLFEESGCTNIEGVDTYNACYGGTAALFASIDWLQSASWDGRWAIAVCTDISDGSEQYKFMTGAAAVAVLLGPNAPVTIDPTRVSHMMHRWDFWKPVGWDVMEPIFDGAYSIEMYMEALTSCQKQMAEKTRISNIVEDHDFLVYHLGSSPKFVLKAFTQTCKNLTEIAGAKDSPDVQALFEKKVLPSLQIAKRVGPMHTASLYVNLYSLFLKLGEGISGSSVCLFSYGSGSASSMFRLKAKRPPLLGLSYSGLLDSQRFDTSVEDFEAMCAEYSSGYAKFGWSPVLTEDQQEGVWYLTHVDDLGRRDYAKASALKTISYAPKPKTASKVAKLTSPETQESPHIQLSEILRTVNYVVSSLIGKEFIPEDTSLMEIGLDSLGATELSIRLSKALGIHIPPTLAFNYPSIKDITGHLATMLSSSDLAPKKALPSAQPTPQLHSSSDVAIIGMACRFPGDVNNLDSLWEVLTEKKDLTGEAPLSRWDSDTLTAHMNKFGNRSAEHFRYGGFLSTDVVESFDNMAFGISEVEAASMDPSHRLLLEVGYEALRDAGFSLEAVQGKDVGVFVAFGSTASFLPDPSTKEISVYDATAVSTSAASGRVSFIFGLHGPCSTIDTACSSSLVAIHAARRSLQQGECSMALVLAVNILSPSASAIIATAGMTSPDGKCHTFDEAANGFCRGEGCGGIVLKRLDDAVRDENFICAVLKGSAVAHDGKSASLTAPNGKAQQILLEEALGDARIEANDVNLIETHGTGTNLGDPIEVEAIISVYREQRDNPLFLSGIKANMGHLEAAAGMAGLFSAVLSLRNRQTPPNAQLHTLNNKIATMVSKQPIVFPTSPRPLQRADGKPLIAAVSSFGYSGTIAHILIEEAPQGKRNRKPPLPPRNATPTKKYPLPHHQEHRLLQKLTSNLFSDTISFTSLLHAGIIKQWLGDHKFSGKTVVPGASLVEMFAAAGMFWSRKSGLKAICLANVRLGDALPVNEGIGDETSLRCSINQAGELRLDAIDSLNHSEAMILADPHTDWEVLSNNFVASKAVCSVPVDIQKIFSRFASLGLDYGPSFQLIRDIRASPDGFEIICELDMVDENFKPSYFIPPPLFTLALDTLAVGCTAREEGGKLQVLKSVEKVKFPLSAKERLWSRRSCHVHISIKNKSSFTTEYDCSLVTDSQVVLRCESVVASSIEGEASTSCLELVSKWVETPPLQRPTSGTTHLVLSSSMSISTELANVLGSEMFEATDLDLFLSDTRSIEMYDAIVMFCVGEDQFTTETPSPRLSPPEGVEVQSWLKAIERASSLSSRLLFLHSQSRYLLGMVLSAQLEFPRVEMVVVEVKETTQEGMASPITPLSLAKSAQNELHAQEKDIEVLYHNGERMARRYSTLHPGLAVLPREGAYIITGGLGGLGLLTAKVLTRIGVKQIVLVSRSGVVSHKGQGLEASLAWLQTESGADVRIMKCDMSDEPSVIQMLDGVRRIKGWEAGIKGIIHSAGVYRAALIKDGGAAGCLNEVWASKVLGAYNLHKNTLGDHLHCFVCYSSISSAVGDRGISAYGAANAYLDGLAEARVDQGLPALTFRWPSISGVGMGAALVAAGVENTTIFKSIDPLECERIIERIFSLAPLDPAHSVVTGYNILDEDLQGLRIWTQFETAKGPRKPKSTTVARPAHERTEVVQTITTTVLSLIGKEEIPYDVQLLDVGLDSLGATELVSKLSKLLNLRLSPTLVFSYPTLNDITRHILALLGLAEPASSVPPTTLQQASLTSDVALIGMACIFPGGVSNLESLWQVQANKLDLMTETPFSRWDAEAIIAEMAGQQNANQLRYGAFMPQEAVEGFRNILFGISDVEASQMDPSQRLLLEIGYQALVDAGLSLSALRGTDVGVFVAIGGSISSEGVAGSKYRDMSVYDATSSSMSVAAGRISFLFGFTGPCSTIDTACSSSLVALHYARRSLQLGECSVALVLAVNVLTVYNAMLTSIAGMTSPDGKCHTFDESANGYCRAEGCGAIVLKRFEDVTSDGNGVYALVKGSAVRQDGKSASLTAPNGQAQENLLRLALSDAGMSPSEVRYLEAHGTGTHLGDPIEVEAITSVYGSAYRSRDDPIFISSVKGNMGHLEAAAGMAGLFSAVLALKHRQAPPNAQLKQLNRKISTIVEGEPISFPLEPSPLRRLGDKPLVAAVSSFGFSGTISNVILQEAPAAHRRGETVRGGSAYSDTPMGSQPVWQFSGQGTLKIGICRNAYDTEKVFRETLKTCDAILLSRSGLSASELLFPDLSNKHTESEATKLLQETRFSQPVLVAVEYCLANLWMSRGFQPWAVIGHSLGEFAAATVAGVMTIEESLSLVCERARLMQESGECLGTMVALKASEQDLVNAINKEELSSLVSVAAINGEKSVVLSGSTSAVETILSSLPGISHRKLPVKHAFHSPLMKCVLEPFEGTFSSLPVKLKKPNSVLVISTVSGKEVHEEMMDVSYWLAHIVRPVRYQEAISTLFSLGATDFIEMGPDETLTKLTSSLVRSVLGNHSDLCFSHGTTVPELVLKPKRFPLSKIPRHKLLQKMVYEDHSKKTIFTTFLHTGIRKEWLTDHELQGEVTFPNTGLLDLFWGATHRWAHLKRSREPFYLENITFPSLQDFSKTPDQPIKLMIDDEGSLSLLADVPERESTATVVFAAPAWALAGPPSLEEFRLACTEVVDVDLIFSLWKSVGMKYGPAFRLVDTLYRSPDHSLTFGSLSPLDPVLAATYTAFPPLLVAALEIAGMGAASLEEEKAFQLRVPSAVDKVWISDDFNDGLSNSEGCSVCVTRRGEPKTFDCILYAASGKTLIRCEGVRWRDSNEDPFSLGRREAYLELVGEWREAPSAGDAEFLSPSADISRCLLVGSKETCSSLVRLFSTSSSSPLPTRPAFLFSPSTLFDTCEANSLPDPQASYDAAIVYYESLETKPSSAELSSTLELLAPLTALSTKILFVIPPSPSSPVLSTSVFATILASAQFEFPHTEMTVVQISDPEKAAEDLRQEFAWWIREREVRYFSGGRMVRRYSRLGLKSGPPEFGGGAYIVTGGLGGLGLLTARVLAQRGAKCIVLLSRTAQISRANEGQGLEEVLRWLYEESGVPLHVLECDVSEEASVLQMLSTVRSLWDGGIEGIIHCAGVLKDALVRQGRAASSCSAVWEPKAQGALFLLQHTREDSLRRFICYSSTTASLGNLGQTAYGAANAFLDDLMESRAQENLPGLSLRWPAVASVGMAAATKIKVRGLSVEEAEGLVERALSLSTLPLAPAVLTVCPPSYLENLPAPLSRQFSGVIAEREKTETKREPREKERSREEILRTLRSLAQSLIGTRGTIQDHAPLLDLGLDSIGATELASILSKEFERDLPPGLVFRYPSIRDLADLLHTPPPSSSTALTSRPSSSSPKREQAPTPAVTKAMTAPNKVVCSVRLVRRRFRVLFLHGFCTSAEILQLCLDHGGWTDQFSDLLEFVIPDAPNDNYVARPFDEFKEVVARGWYDPSARYRAWGADLDSTFMGRDERFRDVAKFQDYDETHFSQSLEFLEQVVDAYGPFDGIAGLSEGAATAFVMLRLQAAFEEGRREGRDMGLGNLKFFINFSGAPSPFLLKYGLSMGPCTLPSLHLRGQLEKDYFKEAFDELRHAFGESGMFYEHAQGHEIPLATPSLVSFVKNFFASLQ